MIAREGENTEKMKTQDEVERGRRRRGDWMRLRVVAGRLVGMREHEGAQRRNKQQRTLREMKEMGL